MRDRCDAAARVPSVTLSVLELHSTRDEVVPFELGRGVGREGPRRALRGVPGVGHDDAWDRPPTLDEALRFASCAALLRAG